MTITIIAEIWKALKPDLFSADDAAESLINILLDHDYDVTEIKQAFRRDKDFLEVLGAYETPSDDEDEEDYEDEEYEEEYEDEDEEDWH